MMPCIQLISDLYSPVADCLLLRRCFKSNIASTSMDAESMRIRKHAGMLKEEQPKQQHFI
jgi:hypothetical protein